MNILTNFGWEQVDWKNGYPFPDKRDGAICLLQANDLTSNFINSDDLNTFINLIEKPLNSSMRDNKETSPADEWRLSGLMFQKVSAVDTDEHNTSLAGESIEVTVVNNCSPESDRNEYPHLFRGFIPLSQVGELMKCTDDTTFDHPDNEKDFTARMGLGLSFETLVTEDVFHLNLNDEKKNVESELNEWEKE